MEGDEVPTHAYVHGEPVTRCSDGRRFYLLEMGGRPDAPAHMSLVDRDEPNLCDGCGERFDPGENVLGCESGVFHPQCAPEEFQQ